MSALELWVEFASRCEEKAWIMDRLEGLLADDDFGVRSCLLDSTSKYLSEEQLRSLADRFWQWAKQEPPRELRNQWYLLVGQLARELLDPVLYEKSTVAWCGGKVGGLYLEIAKLYVEAGSPTGALLWLESNQAESYREAERDQLLLTVYGQLGAKDKQKALAERIFDARPSSTTLDQLVDVVGEKRRNALLTEAESAIAKGSLSFSGVGFLLDVGRGSTADAHIVARRSELDGDLYSYLLPLAKPLEAEGFLLSTICLYRAMLESILDRGVSKYYNHGVRYLKKLDRLALQVKDWKPIESHLAYRTQLLEKHGRKTGFWTRLEAAK